jgi:hypothetical protein
MPQPGRYVTGGYQSGAELQSSGGPESSGSSGPYSSDAGTGVTVIRMIRSFYSRAEAAV